MTDFNTILFPVDLSPASPKLVPYVVAMADKFQADIHMLFVARRFQHLSDMYIPAPDIYTFEQGIFEGAERRLDEFKDAYFKASVEAEAGSPLDLSSEQIGPAPGTEDLDRFKKKYFLSPDKIHTKVVSGDPSEEIIGYVETEDIDMIIMGTHGRKGLNKIVFGSVAERVVKYAPIPVLVINPYQERNRGRLSDQE